ncbi:hypothetical protein AVEN_90937-1 [Araneus ventricosus]|uniref:Uncharacterized protein n=1 Tax=Araneus ventricosus TaxID=182803 RepID=A0A4Y2V661_ARAVE|nr:hypothetical protein AVEN_90932-1 [Araneus ventricosus]GBO19546.1 hypothetical protein AVEN_90937-1 [Araneus ventricosus]
MEVLRDTGSSVNLISFKNVKESDLTGDYVWARQALTNEHTCLALAEIDLEIDGKGEFNNRHDKCEKEGGNDPLNDEERTEFLSPAEGDDNIILANITRHGFGGKQINDPSLKGLFDKAGEGIPNSR